MKRLSLVLVAGLCLVALAMLGLSQGTLPVLRAQGPAPALLSLETTVTFQQGVSPTTEYAGAADTYIYRDQASQVYGPNPELKIYYDGRAKVLLRFDLSNYVPSNATVTSAKLEFYTYQKQLTTVKTDVGVYELLRPWREDQANWNAAASADPWQVAGCGGSGDRSPDYTAITRFQFTGSWQTWENRPLADLVQRWVATPSTNYGVVLIAVPGSNPQWWTGYSSQYDGIAAHKLLRPRLTVAYYLGAPTTTPGPTSTRTRTPTPTTVTTKGSVAGAAWRDDNCNGVRDAGEPPMEGVRVLLLNADHVEVARRTTLSDGGYEFAAVDVGSYVLTKQDPAGYVSTWPWGGAYGFYLGGGQQLTGFDFGFCLPTTPSPTPTTTRTNTPVQTPTGTATPTITPMGMATSTPTRTATHTSTPTHTRTGTPTYTPTPTSTSTSTPTLTPTPTTTATPSPTATATPAGTFADPIAAACGLAYRGSTAGHTSAVSSYGACGAGMSGPEVVYVMRADQAMQYLSISLTDDSYPDLALFLLDGPNPSNCLDTGASIARQDVVPGTYYIVVDGVQAGDYGLQIHCVSPPGTPTATATATASPTVGPTPTPTSTQTPPSLLSIYLPMMSREPIQVLVDCGADRDYVDSLARRWLADREYVAGGWGYHGNTQVYTTNEQIIRTSDPALYQTQRYAYGAFEYVFDLPDGKYEVELHFAELYHRSVGKRVFDVFVQGQLVLNDYDVFGTIGGRLRPDIKTFQTTVLDRQLKIIFNVGPMDYPVINAIRVKGIQ